ncbi:MAG: hypothetical protein MI864_15780, partial [Pseudomonadales bacterium]|nr:hypothetical protein [Pseudomonadales bacterium]
MKLLKDWLSPDTQYEFSYLDTLFAVHPQWDNVILSLEGKDAKRFLQGQCTCNLDEVTQVHSSFGATCTPKGRMFALFKIARLTEEHYLIKLPSELAADFQNRLSKYLAFFKAELKASSWFALGLTIPEACAEATLELPTEFGATTQVDNNRLIIRHPTQTPIWELWLNSASDAADNFIACQSSEATSIADQSTPVADWNQLEVQNGIPEVVTATQEDYIPQMMN